VKKNDNVDPAAPLIAIIPVASSPLVETGASSGPTRSPEPAPPVGPSETVVTFATWWGLAFGLAIAIAVADLLRHAQHEAQPGQPADQQRQGPA
jgi:hypothetical protein